MLSLETIYQEHADFVWRCLLRLGTPRVEMSDAVQDVFLIAYEQLSRFEGRSAFSTWLFTICRTVANKRRRDHRKEQDIATDDEFETLIDLRADVGRAAEHSQEIELLALILEGIETEQRNVFILFELEKMTGEDISLALGIPLGTVYSRLQLARQAFRQRLSRHQAKERHECARVAGDT